MRILLFVLFLVLSCSQDKPDKNTPSLPSWYLKQQSNTSTHLYGVGEGFTVPEATRFALKNAASRLSVTISASSSSVSEEVNNRVSEQVKEKVNESIQNISFKNYEVVNSASVGNKVYVEVAVDREAFVTENMNRLTQLTEKISSLDNSSRNLGAIARYMALVEIVDLFKEVERINSILVNALGFKDTNLPKKISQDYEMERQQVLRSLSFYFTGQSEMDNRVIEKLKFAVSKKGFAVLNGHSSSSSAIVIRVSSKNSVNKLYGSNIAKLNISLVAVNVGENINANSFEFSGNSTISSDEALKAALENFYNFLNSSDVLKVLVFKK